MLFSRRFVAAWLASTALVSPAVAQDGEAEATLAPEPAISSDVDRQSFEPVFFERYAPQTALDMVRRVPGFNISEQSGARGLGQGGANVLLNGTRFSGKSVSITDALGRIPAADVSRIELLDGATLDIPGLSGQVVNVVYQASGGSGQARWSPQFRSRGTDPRLTNGEVSWSGKSGSFDYTASLRNNSSRQGNSGPERVFDGAGNLIDVRNEDLFIESERPKLSGTLKYTGSGGDIANLNGAVELYRFDLVETREGALGTRRFVEGEDEINYEVGGDYAFDLGSGRMKLIGLHRYEASDFINDSRSTFRPLRPREGLYQDLYIDEKESILRGEYAWKGGTNDWQIAIEGALNSLATANSVRRLDIATGNFVPLASSPETTIDEKRAETNLTWGRPLADGLTIQASLGGEFSELSQTGAQGQTRSFLRPKGFVSAAWKTSDDLDLRFKVERSVGQLNFFDFVASTNIGSGNNQAGNPNLVPEQSWDVLIEGTKKLGPWGSVTLSGTYRAIEDRVEQVPIGPNGEAPGNIDSASSLLLKAVGTIRLDPLGWRGAQLEFDTFYNGTSLPDPLTGIDRPFSERTRWQLSADLRHDIPETDWAYGGGIYAFEQEPGVRLNQLSQFTFAGADGYLFVEHKDVAGLKVRATVGNLFNVGEDFTRTVFANRRHGPAAFTETRDRSFGTVFSLDISGSFG